MKKKNKIKKTKNHRARHKFLYFFLRFAVMLYVKLKFRYKFKRAKNLPKKYIVISNHTTDYDPLFVASSFRKQMYFVASEHITRWKKFYGFLHFALSPIIRYKGTPAVSTIKEMLRKVKDGDSVCIFAEGVRSWNGETKVVSMSTAKMIKSAKCGLVTYKIKGGYLSTPIWGECGQRKGKVSGAPVGVYTAEEIEKMTNEEVLELIERDIYENAFETQKYLKGRYKNKNRAEGLDNILFVCPFCGARESFVAEGAIVGCSKCGKTFEYDEYGSFVGIEHKNVLDFYNWQKIEIEKDVRKGTAYKTEDVIISLISTDHSKTEIAKGELSVSKDFLECGDFKVKTSDISDMATCGRKSLVFSVGKEYYEIISVRKLHVMKYIIYFEIFEALYSKGETQQFKSN